MRSLLKRRLRKPAQRFEVKWRSREGGWIVRDHERRLRAIVELHEAENDEQALRAALPKFIAFELAGTKRKGTYSGPPR